MPSFLVIYLHLWTPVARQAVNLWGGTLTDDPTNGWRTYPGNWFNLVLALWLRSILNPRLALDLLKMVWAFKARRWYKTPPFLPIPPREYVRWRMFTAYGDERAVPPVEDVVRFARWRRQTMQF